MYTAVTNILVCDPTVSDAVVLSVALIVSFHYCGGNTNMVEIGLATRGPGEYVSWVGNTVKNRQSHEIWTRQTILEHIEV